MKLWILAYADWEDYVVLGIYDTKELAEQKLEQAKTSKAFNRVDEDGERWHLGDLRIDEHEMNTEPEFPSHWSIKVDDDPQV